MTARTLKADPAAIRTHNRAFLLNLLRTLGPSSRVQLHKQSGLSSAAVTGVTAALLQEGLIVETTMGPSTGGRPPILLALNYQAQAAIGVKLKTAELDIVLTDGGANIEAQMVVPLLEHSPDAVVQNIAAATYGLLQQTNRTASQLVGIGVGMPGLIDSRSGICLHSPILSWDNVPLAAMLSAAVPCDAFIDNDVNALTVAERLFGEGMNSDHLLVVTVGRGIGLGIVMDGRLYRGQQGGAGELGHTVSQPEGRLCECGKRGCLEAYVSEPALVARYNEQADEPIASIEALLERHGRNEPLATSLLDDAATRLGVMLANLLNIFNPQRILLSGEGTRLGAAFFSTVETTLRRNAFQGLADTLEVCVHVDNEFAWARGAASLALQHTFLSHSVGTTQPT